MARKKKSLFTKIVLLSIFILACFGAYKIYDASHDEIEDFSKKVISKFE